MTKEITEYKRDVCLPLNTGPTGVKYSVFRLGEVDLYEVRAVMLDAEDNEKPDYRRAQIVPGTFTGHARAFAALRIALTLHWDASDAAKLKKMSPTERVALQEQVAA